MKPIIVAGIGTEVGKTVVSAILMEALHAHYWKPIQCGLPRDRDWIETMFAHKGLCYPEIFCLKTPCSPHIAARKEGLRIEARDLVLPFCDKPLVIEGTGGILVPLNENELWFDAALLWEAHWILVHRHYLGSLNHFLLTVAFLRQREIPLSGIIFNEEGDRETEEMLLQRADTRCLGRLVWQEHWTPEKLRSLAKEWRPSLLTSLGV